MSNELLDPDLPPGPNNPTLSSLTGPDEFIEVPNQAPGTNTLNVEITNQPLTVIPTGVNGVISYPTGDGSLSDPLLDSITTSTSGVATITLSGAVSRYTWLYGISISVRGATVANPGCLLTISGIFRNTGGSSITKYLNVPASPNNYELELRYSNPIRSSTVNTPIVISVSDPGSGSGGISLTAWGITSGY